MAYKLELEDIVETKKNHPCGSNEFIIKRTGMDFRMKCKICSKEIWISREKLEKRIKNVTRANRKLDKSEYE